MPRARQVITGASFDPEMLSVLAEVFDEVWASVQADYRQVPQHVEAARLSLASTIIELARDRQMDALQIARTASRLMRETVPHHQGR